jgi:hypothetical protein
MTIHAFAQKKLMFGMKQFQVKNMRISKKSMMKTDGISKVTIQLSTILYLQSR